MELLSWGGLAPPVPGWCLKSALPFLHVFIHSLRKDSVDFRASPDTGDVLAMGRFSNDLISLSSSRIFPHSQSGSQEAKWFQINQIPGRFGFCSWETHHALFLAGAASWPTSAGLFCFPRIEPECPLFLSHCGIILSGSVTEGEKLTKTLDQKG